MISVACPCRFSAEPPSRQSTIEGKDIFSRLNRAFLNGYVEVLAFSLRTMSKSVHSAGSGVLKFLRSLSRILRCPAADLKSALVVFSSPRNARTSHRDAIRGRDMFWHTGQSSIRNISPSDHVNCPVGFARYVLCHQDPTFRLEAYRHCTLAVVRRSVSTQIKSRKQNVFRSFSDARNDSELWEIYGNLLRLLMSEKKLVVDIYISVHRYGMCQTALLLSVHMRFWIRSNCHNNPCDFYPLGQRKNVVHGVWGGQAGCRTAFRCSPADSENGASLWSNGGRAETVVPARLVAPDRSFGPVR